MHIPTIMAYMNYYYKLIDRESRLSIIVLVHVYVPYTCIHVHVWFVWTATTWRLHVSRLLKQVNK